MRAGIVVLFALAILLGAFVGLFLAYQTDLPQVSSLEDFRPNIITQVFAADGSLLGDFSIERRVVVEFADIPPVLRNAVIAVEDADFWSHLGIDPWGIPRAAWVNLRSGRIREGFSTLTMQLTRLLFLTPERTYERKIKEMILAFQIEKNFTKEEIFTFYCNQVNFGHGNYGVEAASQFYFSKGIGELSLAEAALLAGLPQSPTHLSPVQHPDAALKRRDHVLARMVEEKYITPAEASEAQAAPLRLRLRRRPPSVAPHFLEEVRKSLQRDYGSQRLYQGGLRVYTTLDPRLQRAANRAVRDGVLQMDRRARGFVRPAESILVDGELPEDLFLDEWAWPMAEGDVVRGVVVASDPSVAVVRIGDYTAQLGPEDVAATGSRNVRSVLPRGAVAPFRLVELTDGANGAKRARVRLEQEPEVEAALLAMDVRTGDVRAMVGGYDFERSEFNRSTQALRQVGSAFKVVVYAAALEQAGYTPVSILDDSPLHFASTDTEEVWSPRNYDRAFLGPITLRQALEKSRNIPAVRTLDDVGIETGIQYARRLGLTGPLPPYLPIALGAGEATLMEMTAAFATFPNQGLRMTPRLITRIDDRDGNTIEETRPRATEAIRADTAFLMTNLLRGVVERGTAVRARKLGRPIGGKTGTTNDWTDGWFVGFEPDLCAGVWVGFDEKKNSLGRSQDGGRTALPIWMDFWAEARAEAEVAEYPTPGNIVFVPVDARGQPVRSGAPGARLEAFVAGTEPRATFGGGTALGR